jgi:hypothetical protein
MPDHLQEKILEECFPHLSAVHEDLIRKEPSIFMTKKYYMRRREEAEALESALWEFIETHTKKPDPATTMPNGKLWYKGARDTAKKLKKLLIEHTL